MTKIIDTSITAKKGINALRTLIENRGSIFHEINLQNDIGCDARIEFLKNKKATGVSILTQVKSGTSYFKRNNSFINGDKEHFEYWGTNIIPVFGITYNPSNSKLYWVNISEYLQSKTEHVSFNVPVQEENELTENNYDDFVNYAISYASCFRAGETFDAHLKWVTDKNIEKSLIGLDKLFLNYKNEEVFWFTVINFIATTKNIFIIDRITEFLCLAIGDQIDVFWTKNNSVELKTKKWAKYWLNQCANAELIIKILNLIEEEEGIQRGSIGSLIYFMLREITERSKYFKEIIFNEKAPIYTRELSLWLFLETLEPEEALSFIEEQLNSSNQNQLQLAVNTDIKKLTDLEDILFLAKDLIPNQGCDFFF